MEFILYVHHILGFILYFHILGFILCIQTPWLGARSGGWKTKKTQNMVKIQNKTQNMAKIQNKCHREIENENTKYSAYFSSLVSRITISFRSRSLARIMKMFVIACKIKRVLKPKLKTKIFQGARSGGCFGCWILYFGVFHGKFWILILVLRPFSFCIFASLIGLILYFGVSWNWGLWAKRASNFWAASEASMKFLRVASERSERENFEGCKRSNEHFHNASERTRSKRNCDAGN